MFRLPSCATLGFCLFAAGVSMPSFAAGEEIDFHRHIRPILEVSCLGCHGAVRPDGDLNLTTREGALAGGDYSGPGFVPYEPEESPIYTSTILPPDHDEVMPPDEEERLSEEQTEMLRLWIEQGADWPEETVLSQKRRIDFVADVQPILEMSCLGCHSGARPDGDLRLDTREGALAGGDYFGPAFVPYDPEESPLYTSTILPVDDRDVMPPDEEDRLSDEETEILRLWIEQGAEWPEELLLVQRERETVDMDVEAEMALVREIHARVVETQAELAEEEMEAYGITIPGTRASFEMAPIPGGEFLMGSPEDEEGRSPDEGPQHPVSVSPFWMGVNPVTWDEFELFMYPDRLADPGEDGELLDALSHPTTPYVPMSFGMGINGYPAISMTQHAANKYAQWLSARTGHFYRLPTEAEWEYAARAGTTTAYFFGDDPEELDDYAWYFENSDWKYQQVGTKVPNPWGLHDMHGNVWEWTLDQYFPDRYEAFAESAAVDPWAKATEPYPHVVRGGSWDDDPEELRSAARRPSSPDWKMLDPQLPKSIWYHTNAPWLGFRLVRPLEIPSPEEMYEYWNSGVEKD